MTPPVDIYQIAICHLDEMKAYFDRMNAPAYIGKIEASKRLAAKLYEEARMEVIAVHTLIDELQKLTGY